MLRRWFGSNITFPAAIAVLMGIFLSYGASPQPSPLLDPSRHITIDEVKPGMEAYCLTVFKGTKIEKFPLEVLSVVRNLDPGLDVILVKGTDERFEHTGAVAGCSGSPVYIQGRLAGALALGWPQGKDALYGVTPIENMLHVASATDGGSDNPAKMTIDLSGPIKLKQIEKQITNNLKNVSNSREGMTFLPCPLVVSGMPASVCQQLNEQLSGYGIMAAPGFSGSADNLDTSDVKLEPGAVLTIPLVSGDIDMAVTGTVTEVLGDKVFGFGHSFVGYGQVELPMATGIIHTVVASTYRSFKLGSPLNIVGTITADQSRAVYGKVGIMPRLIPLNINIKRYNETAPTFYKCKVAYNRIYTPLVSRLAVLGAAMRQGALPPENTVKYKFDIDTFDYGTITFENISTDAGLTDISSEINTTISLLMNNPYREIPIKAINCDVEIEDISLQGHIYSTTLSDYSVKAGESIGVTVTTEKLRGAKKDYFFTMKIPDNLKAGKYKLLITGGEGYQQFLYTAAQQKYIAENAGELVKAIKYIAKPKRNTLHCIMPLYQKGITIQRAELPFLPATKSLVLADPKRTLEIQTYKSWLEQESKIDTIVSDGREIEFMVTE